MTVNLANSTVSPTTAITGYNSGAIAPINLASIGVANLALGGKVLTANGQAGNDAITYTPTGALAGTFQDAGLSTVFNFSGATGAASGFTVTGAAGTSNALIVDGTSSADAITLAGNASANSATVTNAGLQPVTIGADIPNLTVNGLGGSNTLTVNFSAGNPIPSAGLNYNGGTGVNALDLVSGTETADTYTPGPGSGQGTINITVGTASTINFTNLAPVLDTVPGPLTVNGTAASNAINYSVGAERHRRRPGHRRQL